MFYRFDKKQLEFKKSNRLILAYLITLVTIAGSTYFIGRETKVQNLSKYEKELVVVSLKQEENKFTEEKLISLIKELNVKFPHIVLAQAKLESGQFKSKVFKENNNLFGMKEARVRVKTAQGTNLNHAYYKTWQESVYDYAFYQCRYLGGVRTEQEYFTALDASYAEANYYSKTLKQIIKRENLKEIFK